jgi:hypothetical protein
MIINEREERCYTNLLKFQKRGPEGKGEEIGATGTTKRHENAHIRVSEYEKYMSQWCVSHMCFMRGEITFRTT